MSEPMSDERLAEILAEYEAFGGPVEMAELLAEVRRMRDAEALVQGQVDVVRRIGEADTARAAYEAMDAERRSWESRRAVENVAFADLKRERDDARAEVERLRAEVAEREWSDMLTQQECQNKKHADWWVDSEHNHLCPWCAIVRAEAEQGRLAEQVRKAAAYLVRRADLAAVLSPSESRALAAELSAATRDEGAARDA